MTRAFLVSLLALAIYVAGYATADREWEWRVSKFVAIKGEARGCLSMDDEAEAKRQGVTVLRWTRCDGGMP